MLGLLFILIGGIIFYQQRAGSPPASLSQESITIAGQPEVSQEKMAAYIKKRNPATRLNCSVDELVGYYYAEAGAEGIRPDLALCQAIKETGCFAYGGDVVPEQNNYCGLGTTGNGVKGHYFSSPEIGVRAHIQHLLAYSSLLPPKKDVVDPRYLLVKEKHPEIFGKVTTWTGLNGKWAVPGKHYGQDILNMLEEIKGNK